MPRPMPANSLHFIDLAISGYKKYSEIEEVQTYDAVKVFYNNLIDFKKKYYPIANQNQDDHFLFTRSEDISALLKNFEDANAVLEKFAKHKFDIAFKKTIAGPLQDLLRLGLNDQIEILENSSKHFEKSKPGFFKRGGAIVLGAAVASYGLGTLLSPAFTLFLGISVTAAMSTGIGALIVGAMLLISGMLLAVPAFEVNNRINKEITNNTKRIGSCEREIKKLTEDRVHNNQATDPGLPDLRSPAERLLGSSNASSALPEQHPAANGLDSSASVFAAIGAGTGPRTEEVEEEEKEKEEKEKPAVAPEPAPPSASAPPQVDANQAEATADYGLR